MNSFQAFLTENYRTLNPSTGEMSTNFGSFPPIVLIGQYHSTQIALRAEKVLLQLFTERTCLLLEGLAPGLSVAKDRLTIYRDIPSGIELRGSDVRGLRSADEYVTYEQLEREKSDAWRRHKTLLGEKVASLFNTLHQAFESGAISIEDGLYMLKLNF